MNRAIIFTIVFVLAFVILLHGGTKKRQDKDVELAKEYWKDYKARKRRGET